MSESEQPRSIASAEASRLFRERIQGGKPDHVRCPASQAHTLALFASVYGYRIRISRIDTAGHRSIRFDPPKADPGSQVS